MPRIAIGPGGGTRGEIAKDVNRIIKAHRNGKSRPFIMVFVEDNGDACVVSNMDRFGERIKLLEQTAAGLLGRN